MLEQRRSGNMAKKKKQAFTVGKRKKAVARATTRKGNGKIRINKEPMKYFGTEFLRMRMEEPIIIAGDLAKDVDIDVNVGGGGIAGQSEAIRQAIATGLVEFHDSKELEDKYLEYDRLLLVSDPRRTEPHKPSQSSKGPRHSKQFSKR